VDHLVQLETHIREAFVKREHVIAVFFDLEKAYDTTWKHGILMDLHQWAMKPITPIYKEFYTRPYLPRSCG
jgi:hypothetical protein